MNNERTIDEEVISFIKDVGMDESGGLNTHASVFIYWSIIDRMKEKDIHLRRQQHHQIRKDIMHAVSKIVEDLSSKYPNPNKIIPIRTKQIE